MATNSQSYTNDAFSFEDHSSDETANGQKSSSSHNDKNHSAIGNRDIEDEHKPSATLSENKYRHFKGDNERQNSRTNCESYRANCRTEEFPCEVTKTDSEEVGENNNNNKTNSEEYSVPDGGWGWIVVCGASFVLMSVDTLVQCFGMLFSGFFLERGASSLTTAWVVNLFSFFFCLTGLPLGPLINEFGWRKITFTASFLLFIATVSSAFATSVWILYFTYSILAGISCGMLLIVGYTIVPHYFSCRRGLASGIIMTLDSGGQIVAPPLLNFLQEEYTFRGATLILGGIILNCCVAAAVFHPVEWHSKSAVSKSGRKDHTKAATEEECIDNKRGQSVGKDKIFLHLLLSMVNNLKILRSLRAIIIALGTTFFLCGFLNFMAFLPFFMQEQGFSLGDAALCISVSAVCNTLTRFLVAFLTDYSWFNYRISLMFSCATLTVVMIVFSQLQTLPWMIATMCFYGIGVGSYMCLFNLVMVHYMGLENLMAMMGTTMMCISLGNLFIGPLAGFARDVSGSYIVCIWFLSGMIFISFLLWFSMSFAVKYDKKRETNDTP